MSVKRSEYLRYLLALIRIPGVGPVKLSEILKSTSDLASLFDDRGFCSLFAVTPNWTLVEKDLQWAEGKDCHIITWEDKEYPALLKEIHDAPPILFVRGNLKLISRPQIGIVGSRNPSSNGREIAHNFAKHFSEVGFSVTSGLAEGIDAAAHKGALLGAASTIAVLGNGLDQVYPASHRHLAQDVIEQGALVSEFPIGTPPLASHFPRRNRIISGLSMGILVVEAALKSGSLITAKHALEQGREVFAIPGSIYSVLAKGCHALIRQGAKLVETAEDVLEELGALAKYIANPKIKLAAKRASSLSESEEAFLAHMGYESTSVDAIVTRSGLTASEVSSMLLELELQGRVVSVPGGYARTLMV